MLPYLEQDNLFRSALGTVPFPPPVGPTTVLLPGQQQRLQPAGDSLPLPFGSERRSGRRRDDRWGIRSARPVTRGNALLSIQGDLTNPPTTVTPQGKARIADITDGTSNTILHAEKYARCSNNDHAAGVPGRRHGVGVLHVPCSPGSRRP